MSLQPDVHVFYYADFCLHSLSHISFLQTPTASYHAESACGFVVSVEKNRIMASNFLLYGDNLAQL